MISKNIYIQISVYHVNSQCLAIPEIIVSAECTLFWNERIHDTAFESIFSGVQPSSLDTKVGTTDLKDIRYALPFLRSK